MGRFLNEIIKESNSDTGKYFSLNSQNKEFLECSYKVIIIGTITSRYNNSCPGRLFYYASRSGRNNMYRMLNRYFSEHGVDSNFDGMLASNQIDKLKQTLIQAGIFFLDVIKSCNSSNSSLSNDEFLYDLSFDYDSFNKIASSTFLVANSKNAYFATLKILQKLGKTNDLIYLPIFTYYKYEDWADVLEKAGVLVKH